jgi:hypothetical protein
LSNPMASLTVVVTGQAAVAPDRGWRCHPRPAPRFPFSLEKWDGGTGHPLMVHHRAGAVYTISDGANANYCYSAEEKWSPSQG